MSGPYEDTALALVLREARHARSEALGRRVTQQEVATALEVPFTYVSRWERAEVRPDFENLKKLAAFYGLDYMSLVELRRQAPPSGRSVKSRPTPEEAAAKRAAKIAEAGP